MPQPRIWYLQYRLSSDGRSTARQSTISGCLIKEKKPLHGNVQRLFLYWRSIFRYSLILQPEHIPEAHKALLQSILRKEAHNIYSIFSKNIIGKICMKHILSAHNKRKRVGLFYEDNA